MVYAQLLVNLNCQKIKHRNLSEFTVSSPHYIIEITWIFRFQFVMKLFISIVLFTECMNQESVTYNKHGEEIEEEMFFQCVHMVLWEIVVLAINKHNKVSGICFKHIY